MLIGDAQGNAIIVEWIDGEKHIIKKEGNSLNCNQLPFA